MKNNGEPLFNLTVYSDEIFNLIEWKRDFEAKHVAIRDNPAKWLEEHIGDYNASTPEHILQIFIDEEVLKK